MNTPLIIAIDQGTSSCRAMLVDALGQIIGIEQKEFSQYFPQSDWVEHDANEIWETQMEVLDKLIENHVQNIDLIAGIGITNQRETTVVWNKETGEPVYNAIVWQDKRTSAYCKSLKEDGFEEYVFNNTGLTIDPYFSGTKLKWILDNIECDISEICFGTIDSWLIWKMTQGKKHVTDHTNASRTLLYNIKTLKWDDHILEKLEIPKTLLPKVQNSASQFGIFRYKGSNIPITGVAGDQQAALFGQACFNKGAAKNTYGTGCFMLMNVGEKFVASENGLLTTLCCNDRGEVAYALEGSIFVAGAAIQWLRDGLKIIKDTSETDAIAESIKDQNDVIVVPAFSGLGAPYWNMDSRGAIFGLTRASGVEQIVKATLDALAYRTKDVLDAMSKDSGMPLRILKVDGGACKNNYLMQFQSDILQTDVERPENIESTAMGAAYLAGLTLGMWDAQLISENRKIERTFVRKKGKEIQKELYAKWQKAIERSLDWME